MEWGSGICALLIILSKGAGCWSCVTMSGQKDFETDASSYFDCRCTDPEYKEHRIIWLSPHGDEIPNGLGNSTDVFTQPIDGGVRVYISRITKSLAGTYKCVLKGEKDSDVKYLMTLTVQAYDRLEFYATEEKQFAIKGQDSIIKCLARGKEAPLMMWYKGKEPKGPVRLGEHEKYKVVEEGLRIHNVGESDAGSYRCSAVVPTTGERKHRDITVEIITRPHVNEIKATPSARVLVGEHLVLDCTAGGIPHPDYSWNKTLENVSLRNVMKSKLKTISQNSKKLVFSKVRADDAGVYRCIATNQAGTDSLDIDVEVLVPSAIDKFANITSSEGSIAQLICEASGRPPPKIIVLRENHEKVDDTVSVIQQYSVTSHNQSRYVLTINNVSEHHGGIYICNATNEVGTASKSTEISVQFKPRLTQDFPDTVWGWSGISVNISCDHKSNPPTIVRWRLIQNATTTIELDEFTNSTFITVDINDNFTNYGTYECVLANVLGQTRRSVWLKEGFAPSVTPKIDSALEVTPTTVSFKIIIPQVLQGPPVIGVKCEYDLAANYDIISIHKTRVWSSDRSHYKIDGLKPNTTYSFKFLITNQVGEGPWGEPVSIHTLNSKVPEPPAWSDETVVSVQSGPVAYDAELRWHAPEDNGGTLERYSLVYCRVIEDEYNEEVECDEASLPPERTSLEWYQLMEANSTYSVHLVAHNAQGNSSASERLKIVTPEWFPLGRRVTPAVSAEVLMGVTVVIVLLCILALDLVLFCWKRQGMIAGCYIRRRKQRRSIRKASRDKKGLLKESDPAATGGTLRRPESHYAPTGTLTGKHSAV